MNQSTVPHEEIKVRLSICCEFLLDEEKPIKEAYESLINKLGRTLMEVSEFEYWHKRFRNNQFDLGYDTNLDGKEKTNVADEVSTIEMSEQDKDTVKIADIPHKIKPQLKGVKNVPIVAIEKRKLDTGKLADVSNEIAPKVRKTESVSAQIVKKTMDYQFDIQNVSHYLLAKEHIDRISKVFLDFSSGYCMMKFDDTRICIGGTTDWCLDDEVYKNAENIKTIKTADPEKSIIDHLWFVLKHLKLELRMLFINNYATNESMDFEKLNSMLQSMFKSFEHQIRVIRLYINAFDVDTFVTILKHSQPGTLCCISSGALTQMPENCQQMREIVEMDQWKQATRISADICNSLTFDDFLHCESFSISWNKVTPEDVVRVRDHFLNPPERKLRRVVFFVTNKMDLDEIEKALGSGHLKRFRNESNDEITYHYPLQDSKKILCLSVHGYLVFFRKIDKK